MTRQTDFRLPAFAGYLALAAFFATGSPAATWTVNNTGVNQNCAGITTASSTITLPCAINNAASGDTVNFNLPNPSTITLSQYESINIYNNITINGPGISQLTITNTGPYDNPIVINSGAVIIANLTVSAATEFN